MFKADFDQVPRGRLIFEFIILFVVLPVLVGLYPVRGLALAVLLAATAYAALLLHRMPGFSWRAEWRGHALAPRDLKIIVARFALAALVVCMITNRIDRDLLFSFPAQRPKIWAIVMLVYPLLSALPQELLFRSFFLRRYAVLFRGGWMPAVNALAFGFTHILFGNMISPILSAFCGYFLNWSYRRHRSLGRVFLEHALYGDMIFTIGLGIYFVLRH